MMFPLMTLPDGTEIVYSDIRKDKQGKDFVRVYAERWNDARRRFDSISLILPDESVEVDGFPENEMLHLVEGLKKKSNVIWELASNAYAKSRTNSGI